MSFICQECKEPLQLDTSLIDLAPAARNMLLDSLPKTNKSAQDYSTKQALANFPADSRTAWLRAHSQNPNSSQQASPSSPPSHDLARTPGSKTKTPTSTSPRALSKQPQSTALRAQDPAESFVYLKDSVIQSGPSSHNRAKSSSSPRMAYRTKSGAVAPISKPPSHAKSPSDDRGQGHSFPTSPRTSVSQQPEPNPSTPTSPISHHLRSTQKLFNLLSTRTDIDHPLCAECTSILLSGLKKQLDEISKERDGYVAFEREVNKKGGERDKAGKVNVGKDKEAEEAEKKLEKLKVDEKLAAEKLKEAERERQALEEEMKVLEEEEKALAAEESEFWLQHNTTLLTTASRDSSLASLLAAYASDALTLEKLERTNVYNDAFCIGHDGVFGTINGLRLGRVPGVQVEWAEINAAWGQSLLLLHTIGRKLDYTFPHHRLVPMGSFSRIEQYAPGPAPPGSSSSSNNTAGRNVTATHELYGSGDLHIGRLLHNRRFDFAMVAFLECLKGLCEFVRGLDPGVEFPHQIIKDKIGDVSVKLQFSQEEMWTRALRHVLLALKILLKWATSGNNA